MIRSVAIQLADPVRVIVMMLYVSVSYHISVKMVLVVRRLVIVSDLMVVLKDGPNAPPVAARRPRIHAILNTVPEIPTLLMLIVMRAC